MASINKLSIRGVRAFSPDDQEQVIEFYFPVTVIVGANGCGKTTIIESLKYAVTGSLPPGVKSGQAFVHDPKSIGHSSVKANIKLRLTNRAGQQMVVIRSMELIQKKTSMQFKALDGVLRTTDNRTGEKISMSHKCTELDRQLPVLLGVSKPILEHVVFCHQEDSSWPLMEGAVLKKRFDDIFDSTRYAKALKAIQETKKEYNGIVKDLKADLAGLNSHKHAAKGFRQELNQHNDELDDLDENIKQCKDEIKELEAEIQRNAAIAQQIEEQRLEVDDKQAELGTQMSLLDAHKDMMKEDLTGKHSARELKDILQDFDNRMSKHIEDKEDLERQVQAIENAIKSIQQEDRNLRERIGTLKKEKEEHEQRLQRRLARMEKLASDNRMELPTQTQTQTQTQNTSFMSQASLGGDSITTTTGGTHETALSVSAEDMHLFFKAAEEKRGEYRQDIQNYRKQSEKHCDGIQDEVNKLSAQANGIEQELKKLEDEQADGRNELTNLNSQAPTQHSRIRKKDIEEDREKAESYAKQRDKATSDVQLKDIPAQIRAKDGQIDMLKREIDYDNVAKKELQKNTDAQNSITVLKEQAVTELENLQESVNENSYAFTKFNMDAPALPAADADANGEDLVETIETFSTETKNKFETTKQELDKAKDDQAEKQRDVSEKSALLSHNKQTLASLRSRLDALGGENGSVGRFQRAVNAIRQYEQSAGMPSVLQGSDPQVVMAHLSSRLEEIEKAASGSIQADVLSKIMDDLYKMSAVKEDGISKVRCPCCTRDFDGLEEVSKFKTTMKSLADVETSELLRANRQQVEKSQALKADYQGWRKIVSETMHDVMDWNRMTAEAKDTEVTIGDIEQDLKTCQNELNTLQDEVSELQGNQTELRDLLEVTKRWTEDANRLSRKKMEISQKKVDLSISTNATFDRDLATVEEDLSRRQTEKDKLNDDIKELNQKMASLNNRIATLSTQATNFEKMARDKQAKHDEEQRSNVRRGELQARLGVIGDEIPKLKSQLQKANQKKRAKEADRDRARTSMNDELESKGDKLRKFETDVTNLRTITASIDAYNDSNKEQDLERINGKISTFTRRLEAKNKELEDIQPQLVEATKNIDDQGMQKKVIEENLKLGQIKDLIARLKDEVAKKEAEMSAVEGYDTYEHNLSKCQKRLGEVKNTVARHEGRRSGFVEQIRSLQRKLKTPEYKDVDERHRVVMIKHETTQIAVQDLEKYYSALDNALLRFHGIKIAEINRIVRELWNLTYKGEDITNIELVSSGTEKTAKKSYNYRVVMSKGNTKLDMRGRCSAGQRVLASIVIRLALAETFCVNCGCIALDEPTVNLDYNNKRGLAIALAQIIASRSAQSNFQLIVITHDEDFVGMMKTELASQSGFSMPEKYFLVRREEAADGKHYSKIDAIDWDELV